MNRLWMNRLWMNRLDRADLPRAPLERFALWSSRRRLGFTIGLLTVIYTRKLQLTFLAQREDLRPTSAGH